MSRVRSVVPLPPLHVSEELHGHARSDLLQSTDKVFGHDRPNLQSVGCHSDRTVMS